MQFLRRWELNSMALVRQTLIEDFIENLTSINVQRDGLGVAHLLNG